MPLAKQVVDVYPTGISQLPSDRTGGMGRLTDLRNAQFKHYDPATPSKPQFLNLAQRNGFRSLPTTGHSASTGVTESLSWSGPRLLTADSNGSPITVTRSKPRVYDGTDWANYSTDRVLCNKLTARPWYSEQSVTQATDQAWLSGVTCGVSVQITQASNVSDDSVAVAIAGFRADNGTWIRKPFIVKAAGAAGERCMARVVHDGTNFWVVVGYDHAFPKANVYVFDTNGQQLASSTSHISLTTDSPGYWDIQRRPGTSEVVFVQTSGASGTANTVLYYRMTYATGSISFTDQTDPTIACTGVIAWASNLQDSNMYLLTGSAPSSGSGVKLKGHRVNVVSGTMAVDHTYPVNIDTVSVPDTLIGFTEASTDGNSAHKNLVLSYGEPSVTSATGIPFDPALRYIKSYRCTWANAVTFVRQTDSVCHVSRAFPIDDDWYAFTYYQSGSGLYQPDLIDIEIQGGDYMYGAAEQKIKVQANDLFQGSAQTFLFSAGQGNGVVVTQAVAAANIDGGGTPDSVVMDTAIGFGTVPDGTPVLKWTFKNLTSTNLATESLLKLVGSSNSDANHNWRVIHCGSVTGNHIFYTPLVNELGGTLTVTGNFTTTGTAELVSLTLYTCPGFSDIYTGSLPDILINGNVTVTGAATSGNNGSFTIYKTSPVGVVVLTTTQVSHTSESYTAVTTPNFVNQLRFNGESADSFDDSYIGATLNITLDSLPPNNGDFEITDGDGTAVYVDSDLMLPELVQASALPVVTVLLPAGKNAYTFFLQDADFDYTFQDAIISVTDAKHTENSGLFQIDQIVDNDTVITHPIATPGTPRNELFTDPPTFISILKQPALSPQIQPQYFITPLGDVTTAQVGALELGLAYNDWRREGIAADIGANNPYFLHVSTPVTDNNGIMLTLPFRAVTVTEQSATVIGGQVSTSAISAAIVGTKQIKVATNTSLPSFGTACGDLIPGCLAATYDGGSFVEAGVLIGLERPSIQSEQEATNPALVKGATYFYVACLEAFDATGDRIWTAPSPALKVVLSGDNTSVTLAGHLPIPLNTDGSVVTGGYYGLSNRVRLGLSMYRTCIRNGLPTTGHYKITDDLAANGLAPISDSNDSGFAFPDKFTYTYKDENLDSVVLNNELLYTDQGQLPRFHPPAFQQGTQGWQERDWLLGYDGAIWFDGPHNEGEANWYSPLFRVPTPFEPTAVANLESFLAGFALDSKWYLPNFQPPVNSVVKIPAWQRLPLEGGSTGVVCQVTGGVAYASNYGGCWKMTRDLRDEWMSQEELDDLTPLVITSIVVDKKQRLHVLTTADKWFMFDQVAKRWTRWIIPDTGIRLACIVSGVVNYAGISGIVAYDDSTYNDIIAGATTGCPLGFAMSGLNFANVTGVKRCYMFQLRGKYKAAHSLTLAVSTPDENLALVSVSNTITPDPTKPYVIDVYPAELEEASSYGLTVDASFSGTPGDSFELDVIGAEVGVDTRAGINRSTQQMAKT